MSKLSAITTCFIFSIMMFSNAQQNHESQLPTSAKDIPVYFQREFAKGNLENLMKIYEPNSIFVTEPGTIVQYDQIKTVLSQFLSTGLPIKASVRHIYEKDGVALMIVDWSMEGIGPDGKEIKMEGTACDIARRQQDGTWKYFIDNPFGTLKIPSSTVN